MANARRRRMAPSAQRISRPDRRRDRRLGHRRGHESRTCAMDRPLGRSRHYPLPSRGMAGPRSGHIRQQRVQLCGNGCCRSANRWIMGIHHGCWAGHGIRHTPSRTAASVRPKSGFHQLRAVRRAIERRSRFPLHRQSRAYWTALEPAGAASDRTVCGPVDRSGRVRAASINGGRMVPLCAVDSTRAADRGLRGINLDRTPSPFRGA